MTDDDDETALDVVLPDSDPKADPGYRLHLYRETRGNTVLAEEQVLPEKVNDPRANRIIRTKRIWLKVDEIRWLRDHLTTILDQVEQEGWAK